jgi:hypothetical protein
MVCRLLLVTTDTCDNIIHPNLGLNKVPLFVMLSAVHEVLGSNNTLKLFLGATIYQITSTKKLPMAASALLVSFILIGVRTSFTAYTFVNSVVADLLHPHYLPN